MRNKRILAFNRLVTHNCWAFVELRSLHDFGEEFDAGRESFFADAEAA